MSSGNFISRTKTCFDFVIFEHNHLDTQRTENKTGQFTEQISCPGKQQTTDMHVMFVD